MNSSWYLPSYEGWTGRLVTQIECVELGLTEGVVKTRSVVGEQGDVLVVNETSVEQFRDLDGVVELRTRLSSVPLLFLRTMMSSISLCQMGK